MSSTRQALSAGHFELVDVLGTGAFATVLVARDRRMGGALVALKVLKDEWLADPTAVNRFRDEARILNALRHEAIVVVEPVLDYDGRPVLQMEYVAGATLEELFVTRPAGLPWTAAVDACRCVAEALDAAYNGPFGPSGEPMRIIHRDVKPANVMVGSDGAVKLLDFGIATGSFDDRRARSLYNVAGTAGYDAPERRFRERGPETPGSDVYALGVTLFVLLTRKALLLAHEGEAHDRAALSAVARIAPDGMADPSELRAFVARMLAFDVASRPSMREVSDALGGLLRTVGQAPGAIRVAAGSAASAHAARRRRPVAGSPEHARLRFLEDQPSTPPPARLSEPEAAKRLRDLLAAPQWEKRVTELQRLLDAAPGTVAGPFLSILDRARVSWWQFWVTPARPTEVEASLLVLCDHPAPDVVRRANTLATHPNERVAHAARYVLERAARANS